MNHQHSTKGRETPVYEPQEGQRDNGVKSVALLPSKNTSFHPSNTVLPVSLLTYNHSFPSFSCDFMSGKANTGVTSVWFWEAPDDGCLYGVDEPHHNHNTHHVCLPAFSLLVLFHSHSQPHTNGVHVMVSPICVLIHSANGMCHLPLSQTHSHPHFYLPTQQTHIMWEFASQQIPNTQTQSR